MPKFICERSSFGVMIISISLYNSSLRKASERPQRRENCAVAPFFARLRGSFDDQVEVISHQAAGAEGQGKKLKR